MSNWRDRVRDIRKARGWTQKRLAQEIGCCPGTVSRWETGKGQPGAKNAKVLEQLESPKPARSAAQRDFVGDAVRAQIVERLRCGGRTRVLLRNAQGMRYIDW